jgi:hypothetical protein
MASLEKFGDEVDGALVIADLPFPSPEELELNDERRRELESTYFRSYGRLWSLGLPIHKFRDLLGVIVPRERIDEAELAIREIRESYEKLNLSLKPKLVLIRLSKEESDGLARLVTG